MRTLRAVAAILAAPARLNAKQAATLNLLPAPVLQMHLAALRNQVEERLMIKRMELIEMHASREYRNQRVSQSDMESTGEINFTGATIYDRHPSALYQ